MGSAGGSTRIVDAAAARNEGLQRRAGEREAERVAHGRADVGDRSSGGGGGAITTASSPASATTSREP